MTNVIDNIGMTGVGAAPKKEEINLKPKCYAQRCRGSTGRGAEDGNEREACQPRLYVVFRNSAQEDISICLHI